MEQKEAEVEEAVADFSDERNHIYETPDLEPERQEVECDQRGLINPLYPECSVIINPIQLIII